MNAPGIGAFLLRSEKCGTIITPQAALLCGAAVSFNGRHQVSFNRQFIDRVAQGEPSSRAVFAPTYSFV